MTVILFGVGSTIEQKSIKQRRNKIWYPNDCDTFRNGFIGNGEHEDRVCFIYMLSIGVVAVWEASSSSILRTHHC